MAYRNFNWEPGKAFARHFKPWRSAFAIAGLAALVLVCCEEKKAPQKIIRDPLPVLEFKSNGVYAVDNANYVIQTSTDLVHWADINIGEGFTNDMRFFRYRGK